MLKFNDYQPSHGIAFSLPKGIYNIFRYTGNPTFSFNLITPNFDMYISHLSYSNCILDCRVNKIIQACGCATYFYPSVNSTICEPSKLFCNLRNQDLGETLC